MAEVKKMRLNKVLREFNISLDRAVEFLSSKGHDIVPRPTTKISDEEYQVLFDEFQTDKSKKVASKEVGEEKRKEKEEIRLAYEREHEDKQKKEVSKVIKAEVKLEAPKKLGKIDLEPKKPSSKKPEETKETLAKKDSKTPVKKTPSVKTEKETVKKTPKQKKNKNQKRRLKKLNQQKRLKRNTKN